MRRSLESTRPILNSPSMTTTPRTSNRFSTYSATPSMAASTTSASMHDAATTTTTFTTSSADATSQQHQAPAASSNNAATTSSTTKPYIPAPSAYDSPLSLPAEMRPYAASLERLNTGTRRMGEEQRYTVSQEKLNKMQMAALEARLQRGLSRRLTGQDATQTKPKSRPADAEKAALQAMS